MLYLLSLIGLIMTGCRKEPLPTPEPPIPNLSKLEVVWQKPISIDTAENWIIVHDARGNKILYSTTLPSPAKLQVRDGQTGDLRWNFNDFLSPSTGLHLTSDVFANDNIVIIEDAGDVYAINYETGERLWYSTGTGWPLGSNQIGDDHFCTIHVTGEGFDISSSSIVRTSFQNPFLGWDTLYTQNAVPDSFPLFNFPVLWVNAQGDSIFIFNEGQGYNGPPPTVGRGQTYLTALNVRTREVIWQIPNFKGYYSAPPLVDGDRLYVTGGSVYCIDLNTGNLLWEKPIEGTTDGSLVAYNDILVVQGGQIGMWGLNKYTGEQIWYNKDTDGNTWELTLFDGIVYCTSSGYGRLYAVNAETGATIWKEQSPNRKNPKTGNASFASAGVAIDPERRLLYTADKYYVMCIKLPEK